MKVLLITLAVLVAGAFARSAVQQAVFAEGPNCPIEDPLIRNETLPINVTLDPLLSFENGSHVVDLVAVGLSSLRYNVEINAVLLTAMFEVNITRVQGNSTYKVDGYVDARPLGQDTVPSGNLTGQGLGKLAATNVHAKGSASIFLNLQGRVQLSRLVLSAVSFDSLEFDLGAEFNIGGGTVDWAEWSRNIKQNFDADFAQHNTEITNKVRLAANNILKEYTLQEIIDFFTGNGDGGDDCEETRL